MRSDAIASKITSLARPTPNETTRGLEGEAVGVEPLLEELLAAVREAVVVTDSKGTMLLASESARRLLGVRQNRLVTSFVASEFRRPLRALLQPGAADEPLEAVVQPRGGPPFPAVVWVRHRGERYYISFEEPSRAREDLQPGLGRLVEGLSEGIVVLDRSLRVTLANPTAARVLGSAAGELLPERWGLFDLRAFAATLFAAEAVRAEAVVTPAEGESFALLGMPTRGRRHAMLLLTDASVRRRREQRERDFVANAAHELQNPLTAIVGSVDVLMEGAVEDPGERDRFLRHLRRESRRLARLVETLLLLAQAGPGSRLRRQPVAVRSMLEAVAKRLPVRAGVELDVRGPPDLKAFTHRDLAERAISALAENAAKRTSAGRIALSARASRGGVVVEVTDTGPGMPLDTLERALERFYRGSDGTTRGFGLGLSIAAQAADALGGELKLESEPGRGTVARLTLPGRSAR